MVVIITLLVVGLVLMLLETILPGLIAGALGLLCLFAGVVYAYVAFGPKTGNATLMAVIALMLIGTILWVKFFPTSRMARMFVSEGKIGTVGAAKPELLHQVGVALTTLRPAGTALINGRRVDVVTEGGYTEKGSSVRVVAVEGLRVVVREVS